MIKYAIICNEETKEVNVGLDTDTDFYKSIGMEEMEVEQAYDGNWYLKGYAPARPLDALKAAKLTAVDAWTEQQITGGFTSEATGAPVRYDSDRDTQTTVQGDVGTIAQLPELFAEKFPDGYPMRGYPEGSEEKEIFYLTIEQLYQWSADLSLHRGACKQAGWMKQAAVKAATTKEELESIVLE